MYWFDGKTPEQIKAIYGKPQHEDPVNDSESYCLRYNDFFVALDPGNYTVDEFATNNSKFVFLENTVTGGVKVGDPISKLSGIENRIKYDVNKYEDRLKTPKEPIQVFKKISNYVVLESADVSFYFCVENGKIAEIGYFTNPR